MSSLPGLNFYPIKIIVVLSPCILPYTGYWWWLLMFYRI